MVVTVRGYLLFGHPGRRGRAAGGGAEAGVGGELAGLGLGDPLADDGGVGSGVERGAVLGELLVAVGDLVFEGGQFARDGVVLAGGQGLDGGGQPGGVE